MPFCDVGINLKSQYAIMFKESDHRFQNTGISTPALYYDWQSWNEFYLRNNQHLTECFTTPEPKMPQSNIQELLSKKSQSRIRNAVNLLLDCSEEKEVYVKDIKMTFKYKSAFMTLTVPQDCDFTDYQIHYKVFKPFIRVLKNKFNLAEYLWKAETQENGRLHYHMTINVWIHWHDINSEWRKQMEKQGYHYKDVGAERAATEIHSTHNVENMAAYLCGYVCKKDEWRKDTPKEIKKEGEEIEKGKEPSEYFINEAPKWKKRIPDIKLWDCSLNLKKEKLSFRFVADNHKEIINPLSEIVTEEIQKDHYSVLILKEGWKKSDNYISQVWWDYIKRVKKEGKQKLHYEVNSVKMGDKEFKCRFEN